VLSGESYYPSHASMPVEEIKITKPDGTRCGSGCSACDAIFGPVDASDYERPSLPPVIRERLARITP